MIAIRTVDLTQDFRRVAGMINKGEKVVVARPKNKNIVLVAEAEYNELERIKHNAKYLAMIDKAIEEGKRGEVYEYKKGKFSDQPQKITL